MKYLFFCQEKLERYNMTMPNERVRKRFNIYEFSDPCQTLSDRATALKCDIAQLITETTFRGKETNKTILVLLSGAKKLDQNQLRIELEEEVVESQRINSHSLSFMLYKTPFFGHNLYLETLIDSDLLQFEELYAPVAQQSIIMPPHENKQFFKLKTRLFLKEINARTIFIF